MKNVKSRIKALFILVFAAIALTLGSCSLDHGPVDSSKLDTYKVVFIFNDAAGTVVSTKEIEVVKGGALLVSQIPQIRDQLKADGYEIPSSYEVYWVLLNDEKEPIDLDPEADVNNLLNITEAICDIEGKVYVQVAYKQFGGTVSFISNGGTAVEPIVEVEVGQTLQGKQPADPTRVGYTFLGWYDKTLTNLFDWNTVLTEEAIELYAKWEANDDTAYAVEHYFEALDGTYKLESSEKLSGTTEELVEAEALVKEGFTHNEKHPEALEEAQIAADGSLVLKVYYSRNSYTVTFDAAGGEEKEAQTYKYGQTLNLGVAAKTGYTFLGWTLEGEAFAELSMPAKNLELVATWTTNTNTAYKVEHYFEALDGSYAKDAKVESLFGETGSEVEAVVRTVTGFEHNAEHKDALESATILADGSLVLRVYYSRNSYTLTVDVDGVKEVVEYKYQEEVAAPAAPEKVGYTFSSWSAAIPTTMPATDIEVVALWTINQYTLTINVDGVKQTVKYNYQAEVAAPAAPEKVGYTFTGWTPAVPATMPAEDVEVVAEWTINQYTLTINVDGVKQEVEYDYNEAVETPADPSKTGYVFVGWSPVVPATMPAEDVEVVAQWEDTVYTVTYKLDGGNAIPTYEFEIYNYNHIDWNTAGTMTVLTNVPGRVTKWAERIIVEYDETSGLYKSVDLWPYKASNGTLESGQYILAGYYKDDYKQINLEASLTVIAIAKYLAENPNATVYFDLDIPSATNKEWKYMTKAYTSLELLDNVAGSNVIKYNENVAELPQLEKENHIFLGWYSEDTLENKVESLVRGSEHKALTLYAKWIHVVDNAKNLAQKALAEYILTDEIVKASKYEENYDEFAAELEVQKGLIAAATSVEDVEKALDAAKKALLIIVEPVAPTSITVSATTNKVMLGASLALQLAFEGPEGYQTLVSYASANEEIATVENGIVKFIAEGNVVITVSSMIDPLIKGTIEFTVVAADVTNIVVAADAVENTCVLYNENHYFYGVNLFNNLNDAISSSKNDSVINILDGKYTLGSVINKSLTFVGQSVEGVEITVTANVSSNVAASNIRFESVTLRGSAAATSAGVYFQPSSKAYNLTFNNCHITRMNTFYKGTISTTNPVVLTVQNCDIDNIGQFFVWVTAGLEKVNFISNNVDASTCGGVSNSAAALLRIRIGSALVYDNHFTGDTKNIDGLFESGVSATLVDVRFNVFENVTKYVHINGGKPVQFDKNLYLDSEGQVLNSVPATVTGAGVTAGSALADEETRKYEYAYFKAPSKSLTLNLNEGTLVDAPTFYKVGFGLVLPTPTRTDYTFTGWFDNAECTGAPITEITKDDNNDIVLYAGWMANAISSNLSYELNGGTAEGLPTKYIEGVATALPNATKDGYTFLGWFLNADLTGDALTEIPTTATGDLKLYAGFEAITYAVTFNSNGGSDVEAQNVNHGSKAEKPVDPELKGYTFVKWQLNGVDYDFETPVVGVIELTAVWELATYTISYELDGGSLIQYESYEAAVADFLADYNAARGKTHTVETFYALGSWGEISDASLFLYNATYRAKWNWLVQYIATVASSANKPAYSNFNKYNSQAELNAANSNYIYEIAYELRGWVGQTQYTKNDNFVTADYSDSAIKAGCTALFAPAKYNVNSADITLLTPTKENHTFLGWYDNAEFAGEAITKIESGSAGNVTLYANWVENAYEISYNMGTEWAYDSEKVQTTFTVTRYLTYNSAGVGNGMLTTASPKFWYYILLQETQIEGLYVISEIVSGNANITKPYDYAITWYDPAAAENESLVNIYNNKATYIGSYVTLAGIPAETSSSCTITGTVYSKEVFDRSNYAEKYLKATGTALPTPSLEGYIFGGWYDNAEFTGSPLTEIAAGSQKAYQLYAKWAEDAVIELELTDEEAATITEAAPTLFVNAGFEVSNYRINGTEYSYGTQIFTSITAALEAAQENDVIYVFAGTYADELTISTANIKLVGPNYNIQGNGSRASEANITGSVTISASNVTVDGLKFAGTGALVVKASKTIISNCYISSSSSHGLEINAVVNGFTFTHSTLHSTNSGVKGIYSTYVVSDANISNNVFINTSGTSSTYPDAIRLQSVSGTIDIENNSFDFPGGNYTVFLGYSSVAENTTINFKYNTITTTHGYNASGVSFRALKASCTLNIIGNTFNKVSGTVIEARGSSSSDVTTAATVNIKNNAIMDTSTNVRFNVATTNVSIDSNYAYKDFVFNGNGVTVPVTNAKADANSALAGAQ